MFNMFVRTLVEGFFSLQERVTFLILDRGIKNLLEFRLFMGEHSANHMIVLCGS